MTSPRLGNVVQQYSCRCQNIIINAYDTSTESTKPEQDYHRVFVGEEGIHIVRRLPKSMAQHRFLMFHRTIITLLSE